MEKIEYPCPCGGRLKWKKEKAQVEGVDCGVLDVESCESCGEQYFPEETLQIVEEKLKERGLWGVKRKEINLWKSSNSIVIRIPTEITKAMKLKPDRKAHIYSEGEHKLIIEL